MAVLPSCQTLLESLSRFTHLKDHTCRPHRTEAPSRKCTGACYYLPAQGYIDSSKSPGDRDDKRYIAACMAWLFEDSLTTHRCIAYSCGPPTSSRFNVTGAYQSDTELLSNQDYSITAIFTVRCCVNSQYIETAQRTAHVLARSTDDLFDVI